MDDASFVALQQDVKTSLRWPVYPWNEQREPWRSIGLEFAAECAGIVSGVAGQVPLLRRPSDLRRLRQYHGLSQRALARLVGCPLSTISKVEHGRKGKWPAIIRKVLDGMGG